MQQYPPSSFTPFLSEASIQAAIQQIGQKISQDYQGRTLVILCILKGASLFVADLVRTIDIPVRIEFLRLSSYHDAEQSSEKALLSFVPPDFPLCFKDEDILVVDEIADTGLSLQAVLSLLTAGQPRSVATCVLFDKPSRRKVSSLALNYQGITVPDAFLIGYGLDLKETCRNLPTVYTKSGV